MKLDSSGLHWPAVVSVISKYTTPYLAVRCELLMLVITEMFRDKRHRVLHCFNISTFFHDFGCCIKNKSAIVCLCRDRNHTLVTFTLCLYINKQTNKQVNTHTLGVKSLLTGDQILLPTKYDYLSWRGT